LGGIMIGTSIHNNLRAYETWARGTLGFIIGMIVVFAILQFVAGINIYDQIDVAIDDSIAMAQTIMDQVGLNENADEQMKLIEDQMYMFKDILPSSIALFSILFAFISQWL